MARPPSRCWRLRPSISVGAPTCPLSSELRPSLSLSAFLPVPQASLPASTTRSVSTARRTTKLLRPRPALSAAAASKYRQPARDTIVFNPPPSAPTPYYTPPLFLPSDDPRRQILARSHAYANPYALPTVGTQFAYARSAIEPPSQSQSPPTKLLHAGLLRNSRSPVRSASRAAAGAAVPLPPSINPFRPKTYHLGTAEIAEIRRLRSLDPFEWTRKRLAEKFGCTEFFVGMCVPADQERTDWHERNLEAAKDRWGPKRRRARDERRKRRELWNRDA